MSNNKFTDTQLCQTPSRSMLDVNRFYFNGSDRYFHNYIKRESVKPYCNLHTHELCNVYTFTWQSCRCSSKCLFERKILQMLGDEEKLCQTMGVNSKYTICWSTFINWYQTHSLLPKECKHVDELRHLINSWKTALENLPRRVNFSGIR